jgi:hypothetical protein
LLRPAEEGLAMTVDTKWLPSLEGQGVGKKS